MTIENPKFKIGDIVYHAAPDSDSAVVVDIRYSIAAKLFSYEVSVGWDTKYCEEVELSEEKTF